MAHSVPTRAVALGVLGVLSTLGQLGQHRYYGWPVAPPISTLTLTLNSGNRYHIMVMVMVPGEKKLELTFTVVRNYSISQLQPANLPRAGLKAPST